MIDRAKNDILSKVRKAKELDGSVVKAVKEMKRAPVTRLRSEEWSKEQELILFRGKAYVPKDVQLRHKLVRLHHDTPIAGHLGQWKILELLTCNYWWPGVTKFIFDYVYGCDKCQHYKNFPQPLVSKLMSPETLMELWKNISVDFIVELPEAMGFNALLVVVDHTKKQMHAIPITAEKSVLGLAKLYRNNVWRYHGLPDSIILDHGPQFAAELMKELNKLLGVQTKLSTAYHPQMDSQMEHMNQKIEQYL